MTMTLEAIAKRVDLATSCMDSLETRLTMAPATTPIPQGPKLVDLNLALGLSSSSPARDGEQPTGPAKHCGGILRPRPQDIQKSMFPFPNPPPFFSPDDHVPTNCRSPPFPKMEFLKFDGNSPWFWRD